MEPEVENQQPEETPRKPTPTPGVFRRVPHGEKDPEPERGYASSRSFDRNLDAMMPALIAVVCIVAISFLGDTEAAKQAEPLPWWQQILLVCGICLAIPIGFVLLAVLLLVCVKVYDAVSGFGRG